MTLDQDFISFDFKFDQTLPRNFIFKQTYSFQRPVRFNTLIRRSSTVVRNVNYIVFFFDHA